MSISTWLKDEQLKELIDRYFADAYQKADWAEELGHLVERARDQVFNIEALNELLDEELVERLVSIYTELVQVPLYRRSISDHPEEVRAALRYLLESDDDLVTKVNALRQSDGNHYRKGLGKSFWSLFTMALDPEKNAYWNNKTENALEALGMDWWSRGDSPGEVYRNVCEAQQELASLNPRADLYAINHFMHYVTDLEGAKILEDWRDGGRKPTDVVGYFTPKTFELLEGLHNDPTTDYYMAHREGFETHLMEPFKRLFHDVADSLPRAIAEVMEVERRLFSRIPKNDFGRGGAWDHYWGAFYPEGSQRTDDAQLLLWINYERLSFGFYIADHASDRRQHFLEQCHDNYEELERVLHDALSSDDFVFAPHKDVALEPDGTVQSEVDLTWEEWLQHPDRANFAVSVVLSREEVLDCSEDELSARIAETYERLFPLILLSTEDDPLPAIVEYLGGAGPGSEPNPEYSIAECAAETHFDGQTLEHWVRAIERKKQAILYGPPGTGKTYLAEHLARHLIGGGDGFTEVVQFHPAYAYEDFIQGLRLDPAADGGLHFELTPGRFLDFCRRAEASDGRCVLIIDEINRANLSRVFGELMYLLEYRDREVPLAGGGTFEIAENVRIIGTMNTADRSIALVDHALRRRFAFLALYLDERLYDVLREYHRRRGTGFDVEPLIQVLKRLNRQIDNRHYAVGITFFLLPGLTEHIGDIWRMEIEPYLEEYFFDQPDKVDAFRWSKISGEILL